MWDCLRPPPCGPAGPRAFQFIFVHALSTRCPRNFWHNVLDSWGRWVLGPIDREFSPIPSLPPPRQLRTRRAKSFSVHSCPRAVHALSTQLLAQRFGSFGGIDPKEIKSRRKGKGRGKGKRKSKRKRKMKRNKKGKGTGKGKEKENNKKHKKENGKDQ